MADHRAPDLSIPLTADTIVPFIAYVFEECGSAAYLGEAVTQSEHMLQSAALAEESGDGDEVIAGALLHDIGHFSSEFPGDARQQGGADDHDAAGGQLLAPFFPEGVVDCVRHHVAAKRYLCATDPSYFGRLSPASVHSLKLQGGLMDESEVAAFSARNNLETVLRVRHLDEKAKVPGAVTPPFRHYLPLLQRLVGNHAPAAVPH